MRPVFEDAAIFEQPVRHIRGEVGHAAAKDVVVSPLDDGDGVDLDIAKVFNRR